MFARTKVTAKVKNSGGGIFHTNRHANANCFHLAKQHTGSPDNCLTNLTAILKQEDAGQEWSRSPQTASCRETHNTPSARL